MRMVSIILFIAGFLVPPMGVIDGTVLIAVGEIGIIINIPVFFSSEKDVKVDLDDKFISIS